MGFCKAKPPDFLNNIEHVLNKKWSGAWTTATGIFVPSFNRILKTFSNHFTMRTFKVCSFFVASLLSTAAFSQSTNVLTVQADFAAFGLGDIPTIVNSTAENVVWTHPGNKDVTFAGTYAGHEGVSRFFQNVGSSVKITVFEPQNYVENGNTVTSTVNIKGTVIATGKEYTSVVDMVFTFDANGKVTNWEAKGDVSSLEAAFAK